MAEANSSNVQATTANNKEAKAIVPLDAITLDEVISQADSLERWLNSCGGASIHKFAASTIPMGGNLLAVLGSLIDLFTVLQAPKEEADAYKQQVAYLGINLLGVLPEEVGKAQALMALRPILAHYAEKKFNNPKYTLSQADYILYQQHINDKLNAGVHPFMEQGQSELPALIGKSVGLLQSWMAELAQKLNSPLRAPLAGLPKLGADSNIYVIRNPEKSIDDWVAALKQVLSIEYSEMITPTELGLPNTVATNLLSQGPKLTAALQEQSQNSMYSIMWLITELNKDLKKIDPKVKAYASVPLSVAGEYQGHISGGTIEYISLEPGAINNPACACTNTETAKSKDQTDKSITFAMGTERIAHLDFIIHGKYPLHLTRHYNSQNQDMDNSEFGARWSTLYTKSLVIDDHQIKHLAENGRAERYPALEVGQIYTVAGKDLVLERLEDKRYIMHYGDELLECYDLVAPNHYRLVSQVYLKEQLTLGIRYDHVRPNQQKGLSHIVLKKADEVLMVLETTYTPQGYIQSINNITADVHRKKAQKNNNKNSYDHIDQDTSNNPNHNKFIQTLAQYQYDRYGNLIQAINEFEHQRTYQYNNEHHQLTRYTDLTGRGQHLRYEHTGADARAIEEWADDGKFRRKLEWAKNVRKVTVYDAYDHPTQYYYDLNGMTYRVVYADGLEEWTQRNKDQQIIKQSQRSGAQNTVTYNEDGLPVKYSDANQALVQLQYNDDALMTAMKDSEGGLWQYHYNNQQQLIESLDPLERKTAYEYNDAGQMSAVIDAKGGKKQIEYNALGQMTQYTDCSGKKTQWQYDDRGRLTEVTDAMGNSTQYHYASEGPSAGQLSHIVYPDQREEHYSYDAEGRLLSIGDGKNISTEYTYGPSGLIKQRTTQGNVLHYEWDLEGRLKKLTNANGANYHFHYDLVGRLTKETAFDGSEKHYHYHEQTGHLEYIKHTGAKSNTAQTTEFKYDTKGQVLERIEYNAADEIQQHLIFRYNSKGQLLLAKNQHNQVQYYYDMAGQLIREHQHYKVDQEDYIAIWQYQYDALGNLENTIRPDGQVISHLIYGTGHLYGIALNQQEIIGYERDDLHREINRIYANGLEQTHSYDKMGRLSQQQLINTQSQTNNQTQNNQVNTNNVHANGFKVLNDPYNSRAFETQRQYSYSKDGLLLNIQDQRRGKLQYAYDELGRLIQAQSPHAQEHFAFDPAGNILDTTQDQHSLKTTSGTTQTATQQTLNHSEIKVSPRLEKIMDDLVKEYAGCSYQYDDKGNVTLRIQQGKTLKLQWDAQNQLIRSEQKETYTDYGYDVFGRRIYKHTRYKIDTQRLHTYDIGATARGEHLEREIQLDQQGELGLTLYGWQGEQLAWESQLGNRASNSRSRFQGKTIHYIYDADSYVPIAQVSYTGQMPLLKKPDYSKLLAEGYDQDKDPVWTHDPRRNRPSLENIAYYHCDQLGTPQELTDKEGKLLWSADYKAWGEATVKRTPSGMSQNIENNHRFQGQYFDKETGLHYNRFRYYDPHMARYISKDPIGLEGGMNTSAYVQDPTQWVDPLGLQQVDGNFMGNAMGSWGRDQQSLATDRKNSHQKYVQTPKVATNDGRNSKGAVGGLGGVPDNPKNPRSKITEFPYSDVVGAVGTGFDMAGLACKTKCPPFISQTLLRIGMGLGIASTSMDKDKSTENKVVNIVTSAGVGAAFGKAADAVPDKFKQTVVESIGYGVDKKAEAEIDAAYKK
ncbi:RHS repeat-associated core domain-containing protein [Acinetobacter faecalis]|uniref:RHS repeat-associated core domain-containing protein n=1 Tax=Acinetobacter faecalis TaxID=2665161 RepID=UPI002A91BFFD|nr:RHS repeat-associated core domain-containing protein [Acinetobacter faecalis]MDY6449905.1 RHS repeat-associated core domain-containing protein [Acinetobacter faecalis]